MKKEMVAVFSLVVFSMVVFSYSNRIEANISKQNANVFEETTNAKSKENLKAGGRKSANLETTDSWVYSQPIYGLYETDDQNGGTTGDKYESNNSFEEATMLTPSFTGAPQNYSFSIQATLNQMDWITALFTGLKVDEDYYEFEVYGDALISADLTNIPTGCDYNLFLYYFKNVTNPTFSGDDIKHEETGVSESGSKTISFSAVPGAYYLWVSPAGDSDHDDSNPYTLSCSITYSVYTSKSISDLRYDKGDIGAIWKSDFAPFDLDPIGSIGKRDVGEDSFYTTYTRDENGNTITSTTEINKYENPFNKHLVTRAQSEGDGNVIDMVSYIWDGPTREALSTVLFKLADASKAIADKDKKIIIRAKEETDCVDGLFEMLDIELSFASIVPTGEIADAVFTTVGVISTVANPFIDQLIETAVPYVEYTTQSEYYDYYNKLAVALEYNGDSSDHEVIRAITSYHFSESCNDDFLASKIVYATSIDFLAGNPDGFLFSDDAIPSYQTAYYSDGVKKTQSFFNGKTYVIHDNSDISRLINGKEYDDGSSDPDVNTGGDTKAIIGESYPGNLDTGEYYWYDFTATDSAYYSFRTGGSTDTYGEFFLSAVNGRSTSGRWNWADDGGIGKNFSITCALAKGDKIYIRVRGAGWTAAGQYSFAVTQGAHVHSYTDHYLYNSSAKHKAYCCCGAYALQPHVVDSSNYTIRNGHMYATCLDCGASVDLGTTIVISS